MFALYMLFAINEMFHWKIGSGRDWTHISSFLWKHLALMLYIYTHSLIVSPKMWSAFGASFCGLSRVVSQGPGDPGDGVCLSISCKNCETLRQWFRWSVCVAWELSYSSSLWLLLSLKCYWFKFSPSSVGLSPHSLGDSVRGDISSESKLQSNE